MSLSPYLSQSTSPYPGLRPFRSDEISIFFGREEHVDALLGTLGQQRFLAVIGPSGCGKSSLVRAGMIPALEAGFLASAGARWRVAEMRPGDRPFRRLTEALLATPALAPERAGDGEDAAFLQATLRRGPLGLVEVVRETPLPERTNVLLLVDQFEEIFRYRQQGDSDEADAFVALLVATAAQREAPVYVALTMRSDFLSDCAVFRDLPEVMNASLFLTPRLTRAQRREAIVGPAAVYGGTIEPVLVNRLLNDMGEESDQLPLMQHVLLRMWTHARDTASESAGNGGVTLTLAAYERVGGLAQALSNHADEALAELDAAQQRIAEVLFRCLSERSPEQRDTRRPVRLEVVAEIAAVSPAHVAAVVEVFRRPERSFLTPAAEVPLHPDTVVDISHESLIRQWQRLHQWAEEEAESAETYRYLEQTARLWQRGEAALLRTPHLENALAWQERERPTAAWSVRYGDGFDLAMALLEASEREREAERQREEAERQSKLRRVRRQLALALIGLGLAVGLALWASLERRRADEAKGMVEQALVATQAAKTDAEERRAEAERARDQATRHRQAAAVQALVSQAAQIGGEGGALLARQAYLFNERGQGRALARIDGALRTVLNAPHFSRTLHIDGAVLLSADGRLLVTHHQDGTVRQWAMEQLHAAPTVFHGPKGIFPQEALSSDGQTLAAVKVDPENLGPENFGSPVLLWDLQKGQPAPTALKDNKELFISLAMSPDGQKLAAGAQDFKSVQRTGRWSMRVFVWQWRHPDMPPTVLDVPGGLVRNTAFSPDSQQLATISAHPAEMARGGGGGFLRLWNLRHPEAESKLFEDAGELAVAVAFSPDGQTLATSHIAFQKPSAFGPDYQEVFAGSYGEKIRLRNLKQPQANSLILQSSTGLFASMACSPDGQTLATGSSTGAVQLWNLRQPKPTSMILGTHEGPVIWLRFSPDGNMLISYGAGTALRIWELRQPDTTFTVLRDHEKAVSSVAFSPDGNTLVSGGKDGTVRLWDLHQPSTDPTVLSGYKAPILSVALSHNGQWLATGGLVDIQALKDQSFDSLRLWSLQQQEAIPTVLSAPAGPVGSVAFSPDDQWLAAAISVDMSKIAEGGSSGSVRLWAPHNPQGEPTILDIPETGVLAVTFSPDGKRLATSSVGGPVRLWDFQQREIAVTLPGDSSRVYFSIAFSPDGQWLASGTDNGTIQLWDLQYPDADPIVLPGDGVAIHSVAFSPDSQRLAAASVSGVARLWDLRQRDAEPIVLRGHEGPVFAVAFSPDGQRLATGSADHTIRLWHVHTADLADKVCARVWRNLTLDEWRQFVGPDLPYERTCRNLPLHPSVLEEDDKLVRTGQVDDALAFLRQLRERDPEAGIDPNQQVVQALVAYGKELEKDGKAAQATALFDQARALDPDGELAPEATR